MNGITVFKGFKDSLGRPHATKLQALIAQQMIDLRGIVQGDEKYGQRQQFSSTEVAELIKRNSDLIGKIETHYKRAINRARVHEKSNT